METYPEILLGESASYREIMYVFTKIIIIIRGLQTP